MSGFYKMDPAKWDFGTACLSLEEEAAYLRIVNAIHKHDGPVPNVDRVLAGMFRCSTRKARALVKALCDAGKLVIEDDHIWNEKARSDLVHRQLVSISRVEMGAKGGRTRAENAAKALAEKEAGQAVASSRIEENRIEEEKRTPVVPLLTPPVAAEPRRKRRAQVPDDWEPSELDRASAVRAGVPEPEVAAQALLFRDHHRAVGNVFADIPAAWRTWCARYRPPRAGPYAVPETRRIDVRAVLAEPRR